MSLKVKSVNGFGLEKTRIEKRRNRLCRSELEGRGFEPRFLGRDHLNPVQDQYVKIRFLSLSIRVTRDATRQASRKREKNL